MGLGVSLGPGKHKNAQILMSLLQYNFDILIFIPQDQKDSHKRREPFSGRASRESHRQFHRLWVA